MAAQSTTSVVFIVPITYMLFSPILRVPELNTFLAVLDMVSGFKPSVITYFLSSVDVFDLTIVLEKLAIFRHRRHAYVSLARDAGCSVLPNSVSLCASAYAASAHLFI